jgi:ATP-dependent RNA helicase SUPV3L1/SUV3
VPAEGVAAAPAAAAEGTPAADAPKPWQRRDDRKAREGERGDRGPRPQRNDRPDRPQRDDRSGGRPHRGERGAPRSDRPDRDPELRAKYIKGRDGRREQQADPNSPFAKLAALKAQLESNKEPS